jgi:hypothetical protein
MLFKNLFDLTLGRLRIPPCSVNPPGNAEGELWLDQTLARIRYWSRVSTVATLQRLLSDLDLNQPGGPVALNAQGVIPSSFLPTVGTDTPTFPVGSLLPWLGNPITPPGGWLVCDGSEVPIVAQYQALYDVLRDKCGPATAGYFRLPNMTGRIPIGALAGAGATSGQIHKIVVRNPGQGYTDGNYPLVFVPTGGAVQTVAPVGTVDVIGGKVVRFNITTAGAFSAIGSAPANGESNCGILVSAGWGPGVGVAYDVFMAPTNNALQGWGIRLTNRGAGYSSPPAVTVSPAASGVTAVAVMDGDTVREVIVTCPGTPGLDPTTLTIGFSGGAPTTPATAVGVRWSSPVIVGDTVGEQQHLITSTEIPPFFLPKQSGRSRRERDSGKGVEGGATFGRGFSAPAVPPGVGAIYIIKY